MTTQWSRERRVRQGIAITVLAALTAVACGPSSSVPRRLTDQRLWTDDFELRVTSDPLPPRAQEATMYTVYVLDKRTKQPVLNGEGRIFATNSDRHSTWNGFTYGPEVGTYHARMKFITAGEWAMGIQFRRDSTQALQQTLDWRQLIRPATPLGADSAVTKS